MRLPPLSSLRGFEAAARLGSFAKAADELCLTQAAVSHQVRALEKELGQQLFLRLPRELVLTDAGKDFLATVETALQTLSHGMQRLAPYNKTATLIVACDPALARHWLVPGLVAFHAANPDTEVWLDTSEQLTDFDTQEIDVIIDRGEPEGSGLVTVPLFEEKLAPMASPRLLAAHPVSSVEDLRALKLIHDERREGWLAWCQHFSFTTLDVVSGPNFSDPGFALDTAIAHGGVALGSNILTQQARLDGKLAVALERWMPVAKPYCVTWPRNLAEDEQLVKFRNWLLEEAKVLAANSQA